MALFNWFKSKAAQDIENPALTGRRQSMPVDLTNNIKVNGELTRGLMHNTYPGYKLAGGLAYAPIMTPVSIMGIPAATSGNKSTQDLLAAFIKDNNQEIQQIHASSHGDGTIWVWPYFDADEGRSKLEIILDDCISDILLDPVSKRIVEIIQAEQISVQDGFGRTKIVDRKRYWTADRITDQINGVTTIYKNPMRLLPVAFANEPDVNRVRGNSDLMRIIPYLKMHHDVRLKWATSLTKMNPKLVQEGSNVGEWLVNNGYSSLADVDGANIDFIYNLAGVEKTSFLTATGLSAEFMNFLQQNYWEIVEASSIPELAWGLLSQGNHASTEEQMERLMSYCRKKQRQHTRSWGMVFRAVVALESRARMLPAAGDLQVEWNRLDALSEKTKAEILAQIATAVEKMTIAGVPGEIIHAKLKDFYPTETMIDYQKFRTARQDAAKFKAFKDASYTDILDAESQETAPAYPQLRY